MSLRDEWKAMRPEDFKPGLRFVDAESEPVDGWNAKPIFARPNGRFRSLNLTDPEFCATIFSERIGRGVLNQRVGDPFPEDD